MTPLTRMPLTESEWYHAVYVTSDIAKGYYNKVSKGGFVERISISKEKLWTSYLSLYMSKTSCFNRPFNDIISIFIQHGFMQKWVLEYMVNHSTGKDNHSQILKLEHIEGIFYMCIGFYCVAFITFMCELWLGRFNRCKQPQLQLQQRKRIRYTHKHWRCLEYVNLEWLAEFTKHVSLSCYLAPNWM